MWKGVHTAHCSAFWKLSELSLLGFLWKLYYIGMINTVVCYDQLNLSPSAHARDWGVELKVHTPLSSCHQSPSWSYLMAASSRFLIKIYKTLMTPDSKDFRSFLPRNRRPNIDGCLCLWVLHLWVQQIENTQKKTVCIEHVWTYFYVIFPKQSSPTTVFTVFTLYEVL